MLHYAKTSLKLISIPGKIFGATSGGTSGGVTFVNISAWNRANVGRGFIFSPVCENWDWAFMFRPPNTTTTFIVQHISSPPDGATPDGATIHMNFPEWITLETNPYSFRYVILIRNTRIDFPVYFQANCLGLSLDSWPGLKFTDSS